MQRIIKNNLLNYISRDFIKEKITNPARIFDFNDKKIKDGSIVYLCEREVRVNDNFALKFALNKAKELNQKLTIIHPLIKYHSILKKEFLNKQIEQAVQNFKHIGLEMVLFDGDKNKLLQYLEQINTGLLIFDFNPILNRSYLKNIDCKIIEIDGHNIIPVRYLSDKQEYNAATIRRKIYYNIAPFLTEFENAKLLNNNAEIVLENFIKEKLPYYAEYKNNPTKNVLSGLSGYLNLGFISSQRVALEVIKADVSDYNKEIFLEELIIRKELSDNFCLYCKRFKTLNCIPDWAKQTLKTHQKDLRTFIYSKEELENAKTNDNLWNATQIQLLKEGIIHGYLRMYWAKKILQWTPTPQHALDIAIYLNDKYAVDAPSPNGYVGILWAIGALHDRAFQDRFITGKIRTMTYNSMKSKFDIDSYISKYNKL